MSTEPGLLHRPGYFHMQMGWSRDWFGAVEASQIRIMVHVLFIAHIKTAHGNEGLQNISRPHLMLKMTSFYRPII